MKEKKKILCVYSDVDRNPFFNSIVEKINCYSDLLHVTNSERAIKKIESGNHDILVIGSIILPSRYGCWDHHKQHGLDVLRTSRESGLYSLVVLHPVDEDTQKEVKKLANSVILLESDNSMEQYAVSIGEFLSKISKNPHNP